MTAGYVAVVDDIGRTGSGIRVDASAARRGNCARVYERDVGSVRRQIDATKRARQPRYRRSLIDLDGDKICRDAVGRRNIEADAACSGDRLVR